MDVAVVYCTVCTVCCVLYVPIAFLVQKGWFYKGPIAASRLIVLEYIASPFSVPIINMTLQKLKLYV